MGNSHCVIIKKDYLMSKDELQPFSELEGNQGKVGKHNPAENKKSYKFKINGGKPYSWPMPIINESDIRQIGQIPDDEDIYLDLPGNWRDTIVERGVDIDISKPGMDKFISRKKGHEYECTIYINSEAFKYDQPTISYETVASLAYGKDYDPNRVYSMAFSKGPSENVEGLMSKGVIVYVTNGMEFDVAISHQS